MTVISPFLGAREAIGATNVGVKPSTRAATIRFQTTDRNYILRLVVVKKLNPRAARVEEQLARLFDSPEFRNSPRLQTFLQFVVGLALEGKADQIKESTIASEVFGRAEMSDESIVRSAARRLRTRLEEYYEQAGVSDPVRIVIPKGGYVPDIQERSPLEPLEESASVSRTDTPSRKSWALVLVLTAAVAVTVCATVAIRWRKPTQPGRTNPEAHELYLKGRYYWSKRTPDDLNRAVDYFTQAVVKDPSDAQAYSGLADSYNLLSEYTAIPYQEAFKRAISAAQTAIKLDDSLAEAHNSLAFASFYGAWDARTAEREFRRALQLNSNYTTAHHWYATFLSSIGLQRDALAEIEQAQALDPYSKSIVADKGLILWNGGQLAAAQALLDEVESSDPNFLSPHRYLASVYLFEKRYREYLSELREVALLSEDKKELAIVEAGEKGFAAGGSMGMLERMLRTSEASSTGQGARYYPFAGMCALLGDRSEAMQYLQLAFSRHDVNLVALTVDPSFAGLRDAPAFRKLVRNVGVAR